MQKDSTFTDRVWELLKRPERPTLPALLALEPNFDCWRDRWMMRLAMVKVMARVPFNSKEEAEIDDWLFRGKLPSGYSNVLRLIELTVVHMERSDGRFSFRAGSPHARLRRKTDVFAPNDDIRRANDNMRNFFGGKWHLECALCLVVDTWSMHRFTQEATISGSGLSAYSGQPIGQEMASSGKKYRYVLAL